MTVKRSMKPLKRIRLRVCSFLAVCLLPGARYSQGGETAPQINTIEPSPWVFSHELNLEESYVSPSKTGGKNIEEQRSGAEYVLTAQYKDGPPLRLGMDWTRLSFGSTSGTPIPNTLQSEAIIAGIDVQLFNAIFLRFEAQPGLYSASGRLDGADFDIPVIIGGTYLVNKDLQFALGVSIDPQRRYPVIPGGGIRWQINDHWLLNGILPKPRIEFQATRSLTVYGGADIVDNSYRAPANFGRFTDDPRLNGAWLDYDEVRLGGGASVKITPQIQMDLEMGYMAYREFNFHRADVDPHSSGAGLYGGISIGAKF